MSLLCKGLYSSCHNAPRTRLWRLWLESCSYTIVTWESQLVSWSEVTVLCLPGGTSTPYTMHLFPEVFKMYFILQKNHWKLNHLIFFYSKFTWAAQFPSKRGNWHGGLTCWAAPWRPTDAEASLRPLLLPGNRRQMEFGLWNWMSVFCDLCLLFHLFINLPTQGAEAAQRLWVRDFYNVMQDIFVLNNFLPSKDVDMTSSQWFFNLFFFF